MNICLISRAWHCVRCPFVKFCLLKGIIGDYGTFPPVDRKRPVLKVNCPCGPTRPTTGPPRERTTSDGMPQVIYFLTRD